MSTSTEAPEGVRFIVRSRLLTDDELAVLDAVGRQAAFMVVQVAHGIVQS
ncbi:hypothetical protein [Pseudonocardia endophytica]|nr:hypothetical protein [Pseudonocardia endophytica]